MAKSRKKKRGGGVVTAEMPREPEVTSPTRRHCLLCHGTGKVVDYGGNLPAVVACGACDGTGKRGV